MASALTHHKFFYVSACLSHSSERKMIENKKAMASFEVSLYRKIYIIRHRGNTGNAQRSRYSRLCSVTE